MSFDTLSESAQLPLIRTTTVTHPFLLNHINRGLPFFSLNSRRHNNLPEDALVEFKKEPRHMI